MSESNKPPVGIEPGASNILATTLPVLIAGAGPTGLSAAFELVRQQIPVRIVDKADAPATTSRAIGVQARTLELLEMRGLVDEFVQLGVRAKGGSIYGGGKRVFRMDFSRLHTTYNYILFISQVETERILRERLERHGVKVEHGVELTAFTQDDWSVTAGLRRSDGSTQQCKASFLIDAEGAHSIVRPALGFEFEGKTFSQSYVLADMHVDAELSGSDFHIFSSEHGFMALFPLESRRFRLIADHAPGAGNPTLEQCQSIYNQRSHIPARFRDLVWSSDFHINSRMTSRLRAGRVFLGGDAAHIHSPAGAQGMNTGIQDMINLCWKLALTIKGYSSAALLDTYEQDRIAVIRKVLQRTEQLTDMIGSESYIFRTLFNHLGPFIGGSDWVQEIAVQRMSQLAVAYQQSPLCEDHGPRHGIHAGDRVPDIPVQVIAATPENQRIGQQTNLFKLLDPSGFTVLAMEIGSRAADFEKIKQAITAGFPPGSQPPLRFFGLSRAQNNAETQSPEPFTEIFGSDQPLLFLVRPDGYVGFRGTSAHLKEFQSYLSRWLSQVT
jgi:2-polyprenyl-6-methoxyphenol hydroxylase-like FAD-dependent oxidoreductase